MNWIKCSDGLPPISSGDESIVPIRSSDNILIYLSKKKKVVCGHFSLYHGFCTDDEDCPSHEEEWCDKSNCNIYLNIINDEVTHWAEITPPEDEE